MTAVDTDEAKVEAFVGKVVGDLAGTMAVKLATIGDRLGIWKVLADSGAVTSSELAVSAGVDERYAREWLAGMAAAGYVDLDPATGRYTLPPAHAPALAHEAGPMFFGGAFQEVQGLAGTFEELVSAFRSGGGVPQDHFHEDFFSGLSRFTESWFENLLVPLWIPALPAVAAKLDQGASVADIGCGAGAALIKLAQTWPNGTYVGYDVSETQLELARARAKAAGVDEQIRFEQLDASKGIPSRHDIITTFDVVHDAVDPLGILTSIHGALEPDGRYVCVDINCGAHAEDNLGPVGTIMYGFSVQYCMTVSLARDGAGLGTMGLHPGKLDDLAAAAGFSSVRLVDLDNPFNNLYELTA
jgi:SAM-dependent methyltransferase